MKKSLAFLLAVLMLAGALAGCNTGTPAETTDPAETTPAEPAQTTPAETEPPVPAEKPFVTAAKSAFEVQCDGFTMQFEAPVVVYQGEEGDDGWGKHTFPGLTRTADGLIRVMWAYGEDRVGGSSTTFAKMTVNEGKSWVPGNSATKAPHLLADGSRFGTFVSRGTTNMFSTNAYTPVQSWSNGSYKRFFAEDLAKDPKAEEYGIVSFEATYQEAGSDETIRIPVTVNWPYAPLTVHPGGHLYTLSGVFALSGANTMVSADGKLYAVIYCGGFDSTASSREEALNCGVPAEANNVYIFESADGYTWDFISQILATEERMAKSVEVEGTTSGNEGYTEPKMIQMPDGNFFMLLRTGSSRTLFYSISTDNCRTWSEPAVFDECGVLPQLMKLDCGVTVASYGRPYLYLRATVDPSGETWADHVEIPLANDFPTSRYMNMGCFYTGMLALDEDSFLFCYTDFNYPNKKGVGVHTVLTRRVHVVLDEAEG